MGWEPEPALPVGREGAHAPSGNWVMDDRLTLQPEEERALGRVVRAVPETERIRSSLAALRRRRARDG